MSWFSVRTYPVPDGPYDSADVLLLIAYRKKPADRTYSLAVFQSVPVCRSCYRWQNLFHRHDVFSLVKEKAELWRLVDRPCVC